MGTPCSALAKQLIMMTSLSSCVLALVCISFVCALPAPQPLEEESIEARGRYPANFQKLVRNVEQAMGKNFGGSVDAALRACRQANLINKRAELEDIEDEDLDARWNWNWNNGGNNFVKQLQCQILDGCVKAHNGDSNHSCNIN